jgi:hypothetical protein
MTEREEEQRGNDAGNEGLKPTTKQPARPPACQDKSRGRDMASSLQTRMDMRM